MERSVLGVPLRDRSRNKDIRRLTKVTLPVELLAITAHIVCRHDDNRSHKVLEWRPVVVGSLEGSLSTAGSRWTSFGWHDDDDEGKKIFHLYKLNVFVI